jgi:MFS transporter, DHA2 family, methylenomycin A resistance protein
LLNRAYPGAGERAGAIGVWAGCGGAALAAGPLLGGLLIDIVSWRAVFLVNLPIGILGVLLTRRIAPDPPPQTPRRALDLAGQATAMIGLATLVGILIELPARGWQSPLILSGGAIMVIAFAAFLTTEARHPQPMLPLSIFANARFSLSTVIAMAATLIVFGLIFVLSLYFQQVRHETPLQTGLAFLPLTAVVTGGNLVSGRWVKSDGPYRPILAGLAAAILGTAGLLPATAASPYWQLGIPMLFLGLAGGFITPAVTAALMTEADPHSAGIAAGILNSARQLGSALGVAIFGALLAVFPSFEAGMRADGVVAATIALGCALAWRLTAPSRGTPRPP